MFKFYKDSLIAFYKIAIICYKNRYLLHDRLQNGSRESGC